MASESHFFVQNKSNNDNNNNNNNNNNNRKRDHFDQNVSSKNEIRNFSNLVLLNRLSFNTQIHLWHCLKQQNIKS